MSINGKEIPAWARSAAWIVGALIAAIGLVIVIITNVSNAGKIENIQDKCDEKFATKESYKFIEKRMDNMEKNLTKNMDMLREDMIRELQDLKKGDK